MTEIVPIGPDHIESFHRTLESIARERRYLAMLEAPPIENLRSFAQDNISQGNAQRWRSPHERSEMRGFDV